MGSSGTDRQGGGRRAAVAVLALVALTGAALLVFALSSQVGAPPEPELRTSAAASDGGGDPATASSTGARPSTDATEPSAQPTSEAPEGPAPATLPAAEPTSLRIEAIDVDERVFPIGLGQDGELLAPSGEQADLTAWFDGSPTPGEVGPAVIEGHVTWGGDPSVFFELGALAPGDRVEVDREDGSTATFEVYDSARYPKDEFPTVAVYGRTDGPELRLITCSGDLDEDGHHLDNSVVFARLVES